MEVLKFLEIGKRFCYKAQPSSRPPTQQRALVSIFVPAVPALLKAFGHFFGVDSNMAKVCQVTGKRPVTGNNVSHAHNKTRRRFEPNLHYHRFWVESENRFVRIRVSAKGMRVIDKKGIDSVLKDMRSQGQKI